MAKSDQKTSAPVSAVEARPSGGTPLIFISHDTRDAELAEALKHLSRVLSEHGTVEAKRLPEVGLGPARHP